MWEKTIIGLAHTVIDKNVEETAKIAKRKPQAAERKGHKRRRVGSREGWGGGGGWMEEERTDGVRCHTTSKQFVAVACLCAVCIMQHICRVMSSID